MAIPKTALTRLCDADLVAAFRDKGAVILKEALPRDTIEEVVFSMQELLHDQKVLEAYPYDKERRVGYTPQGAEGLRGGMTDCPRHHFDYQPRCGLDYQVLDDVHRLLSSSIIGLLERYYAAVNARVDAVRAGPCVLRLTEYLNEEVDPEIVLFGEHRDFSMLTAFVGTGFPGLEVRVGGTWHQVTLNYGDILVGVGTGLVKERVGAIPLWHRVTAASSARPAIFMFADPQADGVFPKGETGREFLTRLLASTRAD